MKPFEIPHGLPDDVLTERLCLRVDADLRRKQARDSMQSAEWCADGIMLTLVFAISFFAGRWIVAKIFAAVL